MREATREELEVLKAAQLVLKSMMDDEIEKPFGGVNVNKLAHNALNEVIDGNGHKVIFIASDDNDTYHQLFDVLDTNPSALGYLQMAKMKNPCMKDYENEDIALLG